VERLVPLAAAPQELEERRGERLEAETPLQALRQEREEGRVVEEELLELEELDLVERAASLAGEPGKAAEVVADPVAADAVVVEIGEERERLVGEVPAPFERLAAREDRAARLRGPPVGRLRAEAREERVEPGPGRELDAHAATS